MLENTPPFGFTVRTKLMDTAFSFWYSTLHRVRTLPRHLATMASADACSLTRQMTSIGAAQNYSLTVNRYFVSHSVAELSIFCAGTFGYRCPLPSVGNLCYAKFYTTGTLTGDFNPINSSPCRANTFFFNGLGSLTAEKWLWISWCYLQMEV